MVVAQHCSIVSHLYDEHTIMKKLFLLCVTALFVTGCKQPLSSLQKKPNYDLSIKVKNITKRTLYAASFTYMKQEHVPRWRWHKTKVHTLTPGTETIIPIARFNQKKLMKSAYGVLGVFTDKPAAEKSIYELLPDENKIDLDKVHKLQDQTVVLGIEKYGVVGDIFDYSFFPDELHIPDIPELDFKVENQTGKTIFATAFIYQKKENMPIWRYDKSPVVRIENGQTALIDVDTLTNPYDRKYMRGYLAVFDNDEEDDAYQSTFQLLKTHQKVNVGLLAALRDRKVILKHQKYGILGDVIDFTIKAPRKIAFSKHENIKTQPRYSS